MSESSWAALIGLGVYFAIRLVDYWLPKGRHWKWVEKYSQTDTPPPEPDED